MKQSHADLPATPHRCALPAGFRAAGMWAGVKKEGRGLDLGLVVADAPAPACAMFTQNRLLGAHVDVCREQFARSGGLVQALLVNSGNANCATGERGRDDARALCAEVARVVACRPEHVLCVSTGVIGAHLPVDRIRAALPRLAGALAHDAGDFSRAILTTDTGPKCKVAPIGSGGGSGGGSSASVTGIAKGAGMIHPDMATMLAFLLTDAALGAAPRELLARVVERSFHRVSIDGDTSPNDTVLLWSTRHRGARDAGPDPGLEPALVEVASHLCRRIARDGEGASRLVTVEVRGAPSDADAARVGRVIATSPLTKTAIAGRDPNWGRILSAAGRSGVPFDATRAAVWIGSVRVFEDGGPHPEREGEASRHLREEEDVVIGVDLAAGGGAADVWTCDLTADYVRINADYRS